MNKKIFLLLLMVIVCVTSVNAVVLSETVQENTKNKPSARLTSEGFEILVNNTGCELRNATIFDPTHNTCDTIYLMSKEVNIFNPITLNQSSDFVDNTFTLHHNLSYGNRYFIVCNKSVSASGTQHTNEDGLGNLSLNPDSDNYDLIVTAGIKLRWGGGQSNAYWSDSEVNFAKFEYECISSVTPVEFNVSQPNGTHYSKDLIESNNNIIDVNVTHNVAGANCHIDSGFTLSSNDSTTFYFVNNTELTQGINSFNVECNSTGDDTNSTDIYYFVDTILPNIVTFDNGTFISSGGLYNTTCYDDNIHEFAGYILNSTGSEVLSFSYDSLTGTTKNYTQPLSTTLNSGTYTGVTNCNDSHTDNDITGLLYTNEGIGSTYTFNGVTYQETNVNGVLSQNLVRQKDRIITEYTKTSKNVWVEKLLTCSVPFDFIPNSKFKSHLICGNMWSDQVTNYDDEVEIEKITDYQYLVRIKSNQLNFKTESVGVINQYKHVSSFVYDDYVQIDILVSNLTTDFDTLIYEQTPTLVYVNLTDKDGNILNDTVASCNITLNNASEEVNAVDTLFTLCSGACDYSTYTEEITLPDKENPQLDFVHIDNLCHEQTALDDVTVTFNCDGVNDIHTVTAGSFPVCDGDNNVIINSTTCLSYPKINLSVSYTGANARRKRVEGLSLHREFSYHTDDLIFNTTRNIWVTEHGNEWFSHVTQNVTGECLTNSGLYNITIEEFIVQNKPPEIFFSSVINNENVTLLSDGVGVEYSQGVYTWNIPIVDDDLQNFTLQFYNSTNDIIHVDTSLPINTPNNLFFVLGSYKVEVLAVDTTGLFSRENLSFNSVGDNTQPFIDLNNNASSFPANETFNLQYTPNDVGIVDNCSLWVDFNGTFHLNQTDTSITTNSVNEFPLFYHVRNNYSYFVNCTDSKGFDNVSGTGQFTIINETVADADGYNGGFLVAQGWISSDFNANTTAGVLLYAFIFFILIALVIFAETIIKVPAVSMLVGFAGFVYGWILSATLSVIIGIIFIIICVIYVIISGVNAYR